MASEFRRKTTQGIIWSGVGQFGNQFFSLFFAVVLSRLLLPEDFGLVAMITVVTGFAHIFKDVGLSSALIQKQDVEEIEYNSVFWLNIGLGLLLTIIVGLSAPLIARFYDNPRLIGLTVLISLTFFIGSFSINYLVILRKKLDFKSITILNISTTIISGSLAVYLALTGWNAWSIAWKMLCFSLLQTVLLAIFTKGWQPKLEFEWIKIKGLLPYSIFLFGDQTLNYWVRNLDNLLIGKFLGETSLGIYSRAYQLMMIPLTNITRSVNAVLFPSFSMIQHDNERIISIFLRITKIIGFIAIPMMAMIVVLADLMVEEVLGKEWILMIPILQILCFSGARQATFSSINNLYLAKGETKLQFKVGLFIKTSLIASIVIGLYWGMIGVVFCYTLVGYLSNLVNNYFAGRLVGLSLLRIYGNQVENLLVAIITALCVWGMKTILLGLMPPLLALIVLLLFGGILYLSIAHLIGMQAYLGGMELVKEKIFRKNNRK